MGEPPVLDGRRREAISAHLRDLAPYYTNEWDPEAGGVGAGLVEVFAELGAEVTERLDAAPEKHRVAFFDALGFSARPPQAARVPVGFTLAPEAPRNVAVRPGTEALATASEEVTFRVGAADVFEASPARLADAIAVDPDRDAVFDHGGVVDGGEAATLFTGEDEQAHEWFLGDAKLLEAGGGDEIVVDLDTGADPEVLRDEVEWHYYGKPANSDVEDWQRIADPELTPEPEGDVGIALSPGGALVESAVDRVTSRWLRARLPPWRRPEGDLSFEVQGVGVATSAAGSGPPDKLLAGDVEQKPNPGDDEEPIRPFGDRPAVGNAFYVAATAALTKAGAEVTIHFSGKGGDSGPGPGEGSPGEAIADAIAADRDMDVEEIEQLVAETLAGTGGGDGDAPTVAWEYWDGSAWSRIDDVGDGTADFTAGSGESSGTVDVVFDVPEDLAPTTVAGHEDHWVRARLVGGDYGDVVHVPTDDTGSQWAQAATGSPPTYEKIEVSYRAANPRPPSQVRTHNALDATVLDADESFRPFRPLTEDDQTLYLGFDAPLSGGPLQLFAAVEEHPYPEDFQPRVRWEREQVDGEGWTRLDARDGTAGLTEQGIVGMGFAEVTAASERFGRESHWIRARVTGDRFDTPSGTREVLAAMIEGGRIDSERVLAELDASATVHEAVGTLAAGTINAAAFAGETNVRASTRRSAERGRRTVIRNVDTAASTEWIEADTGVVRRSEVEFTATNAGDWLSDGGARTLPACGETVETAPPGGEAHEEPPRIEGLHFNVGWARNVRVIDGEILGGSDGDPDQTFAVSNPPAIDVSVWVDELSALSAPGRAHLESERPDDVEVERTTDGEVRAFWVRWAEAPDLLDSPGDARQFAVDPTAGEVRFGDGVNGKIPPRGNGNVRASYETGGGAAGNVPTGAVSELKSGLPFVEAVTNPASGAGGADTESTAEVLERASRELRDRGRAVTPEDYERLAADASRRIARARCIPAMDQSGEPEPGYVTVLVVPEDRTETPVPSLGLLDRVEERLGEVAPASVIAADRLVVRGPSYVDAAVEADVVAAAGVGSLNAVEERLRETLGAFLHPLSGREGEGWAFGTLPTRSDLFALLEGVEGVDHVSSLLLTFTGTETVTVGEGGVQPTVAPDALVRGADHNLTVSLGGGD